MECGLRREALPQTDKFHYDTPLISALRREKYPDGIEPSEVPVRLEEVLGGHGSSFALQGPGTES